MSDAVTQHSRARLDLLDQFVYFGENAYIELAERYLAAAEETCAMLVEQPQMGFLYETGIEKLAGMRRLPVRGFGQYHVFTFRRWVVSR